LQEFPRLVRMTRQYLTAVTTPSVSPERLFSSVGFVKSDFRGRCLDTTLIDNREHTDINCPPNMKAIHNKQGWLGTTVNNREVKSGCRGVGGGVEEKEQLTVTTLVKRMRVGCRGGG
jgi:hypothetical protein